MELLQNKWLRLSSQKDFADDAKIAYEKLQIKAPFDGEIGIYKQKEGNQQRR